MLFEYGVTRAPQRLVFGAGQRRALGRLASDLGKRALLCTDARIGELPLLNEIINDLKKHGIEVSVFTGTEPELPLEGVTTCADRYRDFQPDMVIGIGGGSCLDLAKLVSLLLSHPGSLSDYYGEFKVPGPVCPVIALPTTAGTGSEVTPVAVLADPQRVMKVGISSPHLIPHTAICDPELTVTCPNGLTAISGADALAHAIEAYAAISREPSADLAATRVFVGKNILSDFYALEAIRLIYSQLATAVNNGEDLEARSAVMLGSTYAGLAFGSAGTAAAHAIQYPIGAETHTAHGLGVGVLLPYTMRFNASVVAARYAEIACVMGVAGKDQSDETAAHACIEALSALFAKIGMPATIDAIGIKNEHLDQIAELSMNAARLVENNPRPLSPSAVKTILIDAMKSA
ncbi:iron-containing alcohol dehydrogenase [Brucella pseudogrignonensis]|uniref:iron-containing alcohol dehydrogenase n=1 Tax=Brucella pseudogrignonensis TaxID=419475 RepID=UPI0028B99DF0|nr:iron-containing alcohol dehydrogenase [Brucella pseudogrignonensis]MDT6942273.1 iron-containing alcohol dehydrogenase [Brucella pseudogrignonensis]